VRITCRVISLPSGKSGPIVSVLFSAQIRSILALVLGVDVGDAVAVAVDEGIGVAVEVGVGECGVDVAVGVGVGVGGGGIGVPVGVAVFVGVDVEVSSGVAVGVTADVAVGLGVGPARAIPDQTVTASVTITRDSTTEQRIARFHTTAPPRVRSLNGQRLPMLEPSAAKYTPYGLPPRGGLSNLFEDDFVCPICASRNLAATLYGNDGQQRHRIGSGEASAKSNLAA